MRDLKAALIARSFATRVSVSSLVRALVARGLGQQGSESTLAIQSPSSGPLVKLSIRVTPTEALALANGARAAGLSRAAYLADLIARPSEVVTGANRAERTAALVASNAELSILSRNIRHLVTLLSQGSGQAAREYRAMLDKLSDDVRRHLSLSSALLAEGRPRHSLAMSFDPRAAGPEKESHG